LALAIQTIWQQTIIALCIDIGVKIPITLAIIRTRSWDVALGLNEINKIKKR